MSDEIYGMGDEPPRVIDIESEILESMPLSKMEHLNVHDNPMEGGQHIIRAIADYDVNLYHLICKHAPYPDSDDDKYHQDTEVYDEDADYDNDVDWAELHALIGMIQFMSDKYHKVGDEE